MTVVEQDAKPAVSVDHKRITLSVRPGTDRAKRATIIHDWHKAILHEFIPPLINRWEPKFGVHVVAYFLQRMKTKWGSCNVTAGRIWLNLELAKKPVQCLEYIVVHELVHLLERNHTERFTALIDRHLPDWRTRREVLNSSPLGHESWQY